MTGYKTPRPLCVFCGAPWDDAMVEGLESTAGCDTCGFGAETTGTIVIKCSACKRTVYEKEFSSDD